ncbi:hypothetical protein CQS04_12475 [Chryseomicrobium excrementi]|uniref:Uncharacterized protein n=1 Tax=Chryseomicrobium excrementi TaxID=2041346 RepID=A0A2M9EWT8_9BACL|nr:hypothetical protein CQS04_12475 [Chryseomicrobium excrementi]
MLLRCELSADATLTEAVANFTSADRPESSRPGSVIGESSADGAFTRADIEFTSADDAFASRRSSVLCESAADDSFTEADIEFTSADDAFASRPAWSTYFSGSSFSRIAKYLPQFIEYLLEMAAYRPQLLEYRSHLQVSAVVP